MFQNVISISPSKIVDYWRYEGNASHKSVKSASLDNLKHNKQHGNISKNAKKRLLNAIDWLLAYSDEKFVYSKQTRKKFRFKVGFVTLTLSAAQAHSDNTIKKQLLNQFITEARWRWGVVHYVWRAECQQNGNIHFHILTDKFIPYRELRTCWNRIQAKLGYIDKFKAVHGHSDPNSTDVHSVVKIKNIRKYVSKYMAKTDDSRAVEGNIWGLSQSLSQSRPLVLSLHSSFEVAWNEIKQAAQPFVKSLDYCTALYYDIVDLMDGVDNEVLVAFNDYVNYFKDFWRSGQLSIAH